MPPRPFRVLGLQQIAFGSPHRRDLEALWIDCLGLPKVGDFRSDRENVDEVILELGLGLGRVEVDLMQPVDSTRKPDVSVPALNHVGLWIDELRAAFCFLCTAGVRMTPGGIRKGAGGHDTCFIHPRPSRFFPLSGNGALIELVQAPSRVIRAYERQQTESTRSR